MADSQRECGSEMGHQGLYAAWGYIARPCNRVRVACMVGEVGILGIIGDPAAVSRADPRVHADPTDPRR